jgi:8-amino-7-oxononanoate synthase
VTEETDRQVLKRIERELGLMYERSEFRTLEQTRGINLSSNDYLGLAADPRLKLAVLEAVGRSETVGSTGSRLLSGNSKDWEDLESEFASFAGTEAALYFGSGYAANVGLLNSILKAGDLVFSDALNHASLIDGIRLSRATKVIYPHRDLESLERALRERRDVRGAKVIVTESLFSMEGDVSPIDQLLKLADEYDAELVVDEAHATGTCGPAGRGIVAEFGGERQVLATVHTCGKALASAGAFVCCGMTLKRYLLNRARTFIYSTAMPPYIAGQIRAALALAREADAQRAKLHKVSISLRESLMATGLGSGSSTTHIVPVILGTNEAALHVARRLEESGFRVKAIRPPTVPPGTARIRLSLTSAIALEDIHRLVGVMVKAVRSSPHLPPALRADA